MWRHTGLPMLLVAVVTAGATAPAGAQISGRVIIEEGPIGVDVVFGQRPAVRVEYGDRRPHYREPAPRYERRRPARYVRGMSLLELERYMAWIESEYRYFKRLHPDDAYYQLGWTEYELHRYVDWLKDERKLLRKEHKWLRKRHRGRGPFMDHPGRGRGPPPFAGRGGGDDDWDDDWDDDDWEDRWDDDDWDDDWDDDDWEDRWDDDRDDDDRDDRRRRG